MTRSPQPTSTRGGLGRRGEGRQALRRLALAALLLALALPLAGCQRLAQLRPSADQPGPDATEAAAAADRDAGVPTGITIPSIKVKASVTGVALKDDGAMEVPGVSDAGWYRLGPRPGAAGPAVIVGHVDSKKGPAVFYRLRDLRRDARIEVRDDKGDSHLFKVERIEQYPKDELPIDEIWNATDEPVLRLITCTGSFDRSTGHYRDNLVVYAALVT
jgi:sortase (surface protein transpeptidase)